MNIFYEEPIVETIFLRKVNHHPKNVFLLDLLKYVHVLQKNVFRFADLTFTQPCAVATDMRLAPALVTTYRGDLDEDFM